eukprot:COSAG06_NODE_29318_length_558_cov_7.583878_1_plen_68_part_10
MFRSPLAAATSDGGHKRKLLDAFRERKVDEVHQAITRDTRHRTGDGPAVTAAQEKLLLETPESVLREG